MYRAMLDSSAYAVEECEDGAEALGKAINDKPDLVVASVRLARIDGMALCRLLRSDPATRAIKIVLLTSTSHPAETLRAKTAGADVTLEAPCTVEAIADALRQATERPDGEAAAAAQPPVQDAPTAEPRRRPRVRTFRREQTTTPPLAPPALHCPACQAPLSYQHSQTGGVNDRSFEQWDYFRCQSCGPFQYRHRTRKLRAT